MVNLYTDSYIFRLSSSAKEGILKSRYLFWNLYNGDFDHVYTAIPEKCLSLIISTDCFGEKLKIFNKKVYEKDLKKYEDSFDKKLFDFNDNDVKLVEMGEY